jgi:hypothetical protein
MSWADLIEVLREELSATGAELVDRVIRQQFGGDRIYIPSRPVITPDDAYRAAPNEPQRAARVLDVHPTTIYRLLRRRQLLIR